MTFEASNFHPYLPRYLLPAQKDELFEELKKFPNNHAIYTTAIPYHGVMQGDCLYGISFYEADGTLRNVQSVILSNTCDLSQDNPRIQPMRAVFSPLILISKYQARLIANNIPASRIESHLSDIRSQRITNIVYFPQCNDLGESMILLDNVFSAPYANIDSRPRRFRLNTFGFYQFVVKLSIHFTRFQEGMTGGNPRTEFVVA